jgi:hypothetical protein
MVGLREEEEMTFEREVSRQAMNQFDSSHLNFFQ